MSTFNDMSEDQKMAVQLEFKNPDTTRERRIELLALVQEDSDETAMGSPCPMCKHYPFFAPHHEALIEGHVYSHAGVAEVRITRYCEYCFDLVTREPDEEDGNE